MVRVETPVDKCLCSASYRRWRVSISYRTRSFSCCNFVTSSFSNSRSISSCSLIVIRFSRQLAAYPRFFSVRRNCFSFFTSSFERPRRRLFRSRTLKLTRSLSDSPVRFATETDARFAYNTITVSYMQGIMHYDQMRSLIKILAVIKRRGCEKRRSYQKQPHFINLFLLANTLV